jgi:hypothetical protein
MVSEILVFKEEMTKSKMAAVVQDVREILFMWKELRYI